MNTTNVTEALGPKICEQGGKGLFLPFFTTEHKWPVALRAILYCLGLGWMRDESHKSQEYISIYQLYHKT